MGRMLNAYKDWMLNQHLERKGKHTPSTNPKSCRCIVTEHKRDAQAPRKTLNPHLGRTLNEQDRMLYNYLDRMHRMQSRPSHDACSTTQSDPYSTPRKTRHQHLPRKPGETEKLNSTTWMLSQPFASVTIHGIKENWWKKKRNYALSQCPISMLIELSKPPYRNTQSTLYRKHA